ncbi:MAG: septal ring lytic transglycosylase RlpA family protein [Rhodobacteraceae bacterium]|nr:septal ring lytic transglycosylase RlpA family protein [Paracoccaceae bacterium]
MRQLKRAICTVSLSVLAACAAPQDQTVSAVQTTKTIYGAASWYGSEFQGRRTASGEKFDKESLTAAHPTLPFATLVRVTNESNGKSVVVRINDRGPFTGKRIIDLSQRAAQIIGIMHSGVGPVKLEILHATP